MATISEALSRARELRPHYLHVILQLYPVERPGSGQITADRFLRLYYDPDAVAEIECDVTATLILLQVEHYFRRHPERKRDANRTLWSVATYIAITGCFEYERDLELPEGILVPSTFKLKDRLPAERYYDLLSRMCKKRRKQFESIVEQLGDAAGGMVIIPPAGSAATGELEDGELGEDAAVPTIDWVLAMMDEASARPDRTLPGYGVGDTVLDPDDNRESQVDWQEQLHGIIGSAVKEQAGADDFSYLMPLDESTMLGCIIPGLAGTDPGVALVLDTSSSMGEERQSQAVAETGGILRRLNAGVQVYSVDTAVHTAKEVFHASELFLIGGGGTNMGIGIDAAARAQIKPDLIVVITDGDTPWPEKGPAGIPVIVVLVGYGETPEWVRDTIHIPMN